jgi:hypothetical protein
VASPPPYPRRPRPAPFSPRATLSILYFAGFIVLFGVLFAAPDLVAGFRELPPGQGELTPAELARAREVARASLAGRVPLIVGCALVTLGFAIWRGALPGLRRR